MMEEGVVVRPFGSGWRDVEAVAFVLGVVNRWAYCLEVRSG